MAEIEYQSINNTDNYYSDGEKIEQDIFNYVKKYRPEEYVDILQKDQRWPVFYHLTDMRENILNWYDFKPDCDVLEIGGGMGALTGLLCRKAKTVTTVELTARRAQTIYERYTGYDNLRILVGNFNSIKFDQKYDYITLIGVLEYAPGFVPGGDPKVFLRNIRGLLKPGGKLLIAIENRFGLKYWCGAKEDHTGKPYDGINGYLKTDTIRTYSRSELSEILKCSGFVKQRFFYPLPDYKLPQVIYSDEYLPHKEVAAKIRKYYLDNPTVIIDEARVLSDIVQNNVFAFFANSFFVECSPNAKKMSKVRYASFTPDRSQEYKVITTICEDQTVRKFAASSLGQKHIEEIYDHQKLYLGNDLAKYHMNDDHLEMPYINAISLEEIMCDCIKNKDIIQIEKWLHIFQSHVENSASFKVVGNQKVMNTGFLDMTFCNCLVMNEDLLFFDQEWIDKNVPVSYILFRAFLVLYTEHPELESYISKTFIKKLLSLDEATFKYYMNKEVDFANVIMPNKSNSLLFFDQHSGIVDSDIFEHNNGEKIQGSIYFDCGEGYQEANSTKFYYDLSEFIHVRVDLPENTYRIRFDPSEGYFCVLRRFDVLSDNGLLSIRPINGIKEGELYLFETADPQFEIEVQNYAHWIEITADIFVISGAIGNKLVSESIIAQKEKIQNLEERRKLFDQLKSLEMERSVLEEQLISAETERSHLEEQLLSVETDKSRLADNLYHSNQEITKQKEEIEIIISQREDLKQQLADSLYAYSVISNAACWKITKPVRIVLDMLKSIPVCALVIKGLKCFKDNGWSYTWNKLCHWETHHKPAETTIRTDLRVNSTLYDSEYQSNQDFSIYNTDVKILAFYLPQYHTFPENDAWWGKGFTEWTNVKKSTPRFEGHYQPRVPNGDIGYYCLEDISVIRKQAELAKQHGIYGFCFYYYWFSGKRLMEKPVDQLLMHPEIDIPFCLCWANENWTRRWDGQDQDVLIKQEYTDEDDEQFILDIKKYLDDSRYIRIDGEPLIIIYNPTAMPDCRKSFQRWRETARKIGVGEIKIWICLTWGRNAEMLCISDLVDAEVEFPPHNIGGEWMELKDIAREGKDCIIYDYHKAVDYIVGTWENEDNSLLPKHYTCMLAWDNSARRKDGWHAFYRFSLKDFYKWVSAAVRKSRLHLAPSERFVFINAWNEWGEGTYLEPEDKYGYANINTVSKAVFDLPFDWDTTVIDMGYPVLEEKCFITDDHPKIAVQAHIYFIDLVDELIKQFNNIPYPFDLFITTDSERKKKILLSSFKKHCKCRRIKVLVLQNRGRDVAPFLVQMAPVITNYEYIGHFHTKKTVATEYGNDWRKYLFTNLLGNEEYLKRLFCMFETEKSLGIAFPELYPPIREHAKWNGENEGLKQLLNKMHCDSELPDQLDFPAGDMFWARTEAVKPIFKLNLKQEDFPEEQGQRYATIAHQIERSWVYIAKSTGFSSCHVMNGIKQ